MVLSQKSLLLHFFFLTFFRIRLYCVPQENFMNKRINDITHQAFAKLGKEKLLHEYCKSIHQMLGLVIDFISAEDANLRLTDGTNFSPYCDALRKNKAGHDACMQCDIANAHLAEIEKKPRYYRCHAGLYEIVVPLFDSIGTYLGCLTSGQFLLQGHLAASKDELKTLAKLYGINFSALTRYYAKSPVLTETQLEGITGYLQIIGRHLTGLRENLIYLEKINPPEKIEEIRKFIEKNYQKRLTVQHVAQKFYISSSSLSHQFKKEMNVSFNQYLNSFRITKAKELLEDSELSISEIATLTGFGSISQFDRVFLSETGISPKNYRKSN